MSFFSVEILVEEVKRSREINSQVKPIQNVVVVKSYYKIDDI